MINKEKLQLQVGQEFSNLKKLSEAFGLEYKDSTNSRKALRKEIEQYVKLEQIGRAYVILEIYSEPKSKIDERINNGKDPNSWGHNLVYKDSLDPLVKKLIIQSIEKNKSKDIGMIFFTRRNIIEKLERDLFSNELLTLEKKDYLYRIEFDNKWLYSSPMILSGCGGFNLIAIKRTIDQVKESLLNVVTNSLIRLEKDASLGIKSGYILKIKVDEKVTYRMANNQETNIIEEKKQSLMKKLDLDNFKLRKNNSEAKKLYDELDKIISNPDNQLIKHYKGCFKAFRVFNTNKLECGENINIMGLINEFANTLKERVYRSIENKYNKDIVVIKKKVEEGNSSKKGFGEDKGWLLLEFWEKELLDKNFLLDVKELLDIFIKTEFLHKIKSEEK